jgi:hypothetical protein
VSEQPETPEGEQHLEEPPTVVEPAAVAQPVPVVPPPPPPPVIAPSPAAAAAAESARPENAADRPEIQIGAAFAGGFLIALILKRLAR